MNDAPEKTQRMHPLIEAARLSAPAALAAAGALEGALGFDLRDSCAGRLEFQNGLVRA